MPQISSRHRQPYCLTLFQHFISVLSAVSALTATHRFAPVLHRTDNFRSVARLPRNKQPTASASLARDPKMLPQAGRRIHTTKAYLGP